MTNYNRRLKLLQNKLATLHLDALLVTSQTNICYLTGIFPLADARELAALVTHDELYVLVRSTYTQEAIKYAKSGRILEINVSTKLTGHLQTIANANKLAAIGFEGNDLTISTLSQFRKVLPTIDWRETTALVEELRQIKDHEEIASITRAAEITDDAFEFILTRIRPGVSEKDIALKLEFFLKKHAEGIAFTPIVASGIGSASPHYISSAKKIHRGDMVLLDFGAKVDGYCADLTRVVFVGTADEKFKNVYQTVLEAQKQTLDVLARHAEFISASPKKMPETLTKDADTVARQYILDKGYPDIPHGVGHSLGLDIHELPRIAPTDTSVLKSGIVFTIEPGIYLPGWGGVRIEDLMTITSQGIAILSKSTKELLAL